jgi:hypothetical protein
MKARRKLDGNLTVRPKQDLVHFANQAEQAPRPLFPASLRLNTIRRGLASADPAQCSYQQAVRSVAPSSGEYRPGNPGNRLIQHGGEHAPSPDCSSGVTMARALIACLVCSMLAILPRSVNAQYPQRAILPANCELELKGAAIIFSGLELNDGCIVYFDPSIKQAKVSVDTLTLHGKSIIDLTPRVTLPHAPSKPPTPAQLGDSLPAQSGSDGSRGEMEGPAQA